MADKRDQQKAKRRVRDPETFRERAIKAAENSGKPQRKQRLKTAGSKVIGPVVRPIGRGTTKIFNRQPFRLIGKIILPAYFRNSWRELRLVSWPNWQQSRQLTFAVLIFAIIFGAIIAGVDYGLDKIFRNVLLK